jgi:voltage-gated sodium channel
MKRHARPAADEAALVRFCRRTSESRWFQNSILGVIVFNAAVMGLETSRDLVGAYGAVFAWLNALVQALFVAELAVRIAARWPRVHRFFGEGWNVFDFAVVAVSFVPAVGPFATVARLARILRVARLVSAFPELRLIVGTMLRSIPSMAHVVLLLALLLYIYAILGYSLFHTHDPTHWGSLGASLQTLFQILTLEGWVEIQQAGLQAHAWAWLYYASFIVIAVFVVINLFIAVVLNNLEAARREQSAEATPGEEADEVLARIRALRQELAELERAVERARLGRSPSKSEAAAEAH